MLGPTKRIDIKNCPKGSRQHLGKSSKRQKFGKALQATNDNGFKNFRYFRYTMYKQLYDIRYTYLKCTRSFGHWIGIVVFECEVPCTSLSLVKRPKKHVKVFQICELHFHPFLAMSTSWFIAVPLGFPSCAGLMLTTVKHVEVIEEPAALIHISVQRDCHEEVAMKMST